MTAAAHTFPNYNQLMSAKSSSISALNGSTTLGALLISSSSAALAWNSTSQAQTTVAGLLASGSGSALTECTGGSYARLSLGTVVCTTTGLVTSLGCANLVWSSSTISATYLVVYDATINTNDTTRVLLAYQDFGGTETDTAGTFTFSPASGVMATWTAS